MVLIASISPQVTEQQQSEQTGRLIPSGEKLTPTQAHGMPTTAISQSLVWEPIEHISNPTIASYNIGQSHMLFREKYGVAEQEIAIGTLESLQETTGEVKVFRIPPLKFPAVAHPVFTDQVCRLLDNLWAIVVSRAAQLKFPIGKTVASVFTDPTEDESKAVLSLSCQANISQALAFWNSLEPDLQNWLKTLSAGDKATFLSKISLRVYWL